MKALILQGSSRNNGDTAKAVQVLAEHNNWEVVHLTDCTIAPYDYEHRHRGDDFFPLMRRFIEGDYELLCFATPIYWYSMSGLLKNFLDRITDLLQIDKNLGRQLRGRKMALVSVNHESVCTPHFEQPFVLSAEYLGMQFLGHVHLNMESGITSEVTQHLTDFGAVL